MFSGSYGDVNNTISFYDAYQPGTDFDVNTGVPQAGAQTGDIPSNNTMTQEANPDAMGKPAHWWIVFAVTFGVFVWVARRYSGDSQYGNLKASVYNMVFLTVYIVLILNFLKVLAAKFPVPGIAPLILAA